MGGMDDADGEDLEINPFLRRSFRVKQTREWRPRQAQPIVVETIPPPPEFADSWESDLLADLQALEAAQIELQQAEGTPPAAAAEPPASDPDAWWLEGEEEDGDDDDAASVDSRDRLGTLMEEDEDEDEGEDGAQRQGTGDNWMDGDESDPEAEAVLALLLAAPESEDEYSEPPSPVSQQFPSSAAFSGGALDTLTEDDEEESSTDPVVESVASGAGAAAGTAATAAASNTETTPVKQTPVSALTRKRTLRDSVRKGVVKQKDALSASWWVDRQLRTLIKAVRLYGSQQADSRFAIPLDDLNTRTQGILEPLEGTLDVAVEQGVVERTESDGELLVTLLKTEIDDSNEDTYTFRQIRKCSVRSRKAPKSSIRLLKRAAASGGGDRGGPPTSPSRNQAESFGAPTAGRRRLSDAARASYLSEEEVLAVSRWIDSKLRRLIREVQTLGGVSPSGQPRVLFGTLRQHASSDIQPLTPTLLTAKKHLIVNFTPLTLDDASEEHDKEFVSLLKTTIPDSDITTYSQANVEEMATHRRQNEQPFVGSACTACTQRVYEAELLVADARAFHRACFVCSVCKRRLRLDTYHVVGDSQQLLCQSHHDQALAAAGGAHAALPAEASRLQTQVAKSEERFTTHMLVRERGEQQMRAKIRAEEPHNTPATGTLPSRFSPPRPHREASTVQHLVSTLSKGDGEEDTKASLNRTLSISVKQGKIKRKEALSAAWWVDTQIRTLISVIKQFGSPGPDGRYQVPFGKLHQFASFMFTPLSGTLMTAKKRGVVAFEPETLFVEAHRDVLITLLRETIEDANEDTYTVGQIRQCSIRRGKARGSSRSSTHKQRLSRRRTPPTNN